MTGVGEWGVRIGGGSMRLCGRGRIKACAHRCLRVAAAMLGRMSDQNFVTV